MVLKTKGKNHFFNLQLVFFFFLFFSNHSNLRTSVRFLSSINYACWCPPTSLSQATWGLQREQEEQFAHSHPGHGGFGWLGKKRHPISKILSQGHHVKNSLPLQLLLCPLLLSSSLLFFFNQAVWGCQVFWDEDSQPCEKLIPCGPSSLWRSSPWEHWWWLAGRWWSVEGGGMDGRMKGAWTEGHLTSRLSSVDSNADSKAHTWTYIPAAPFSPRPLKHHIHAPILPPPPLLSTIHPLPVNPQVQDLLMRFPSWPSDGWDEEWRGFVMWRARGVVSGGWQWFTREKVLLLHCVPNLPGRGTEPSSSPSYPPHPHPTTTWL